MVIWEKKIQNELTVEIYSKSLVSAIGKVLLVKLNRTPIKTQKGDGKWPLFVNKQLFWWSASLILDNNNGLLTDFHPLYITIFLSWPD